MKRRARRELALTQKSCAGAQRKTKLADKPGSVVDSHSSGPWIAPGLEPPTRELGGSRHRSPIWCCSRWRLPRFTPATPRCRPCGFVAAPSSAPQDSSLWPYSSPSAHAPHQRVCHHTLLRCERRLIADGCYPPPYPAEPGLSSMRMKCAQRLSGQLRHEILQLAPQIVPSQSGDPDIVSLRHLLFPPRSSSRSTAQGVEYEHGVSSTGRRVPCS